MNVQKAMICIFSLLLGWFGMGQIIDRIVWPDSPCAHWPHDWEAWIFGTTTFTSVRAANAFWSFYLFALLYSGALALVASYQIGLAKGRTTAAQSEAKESGGA